MFNKLLKLYQQKKYKELIEQVSEDVMTENILEIKAMSAIAVAQYALAENIFKRLLKTSSKEQYYYHLGLSAMHLSKNTQAINAFTKSKTDPKFKMASLLNTAHCYSLLQKNKKAEAILKELIKFNRTNEHAWFMLLSHYKNINKFEKLAECLSASESFLSHRQEWKIHHAYLLYNNKNYNELISFVKNQNIASLKSMLSLLASSYLKIAQFEKAVKIYQEILENDKTAINYYNLAAAYSNLTSNNDLTTAIKMADSCLNIAKDYHQAFYCQSLAYSKMNQIESSIQKINLAIDCDKDNLQYLYHKASLLVKDNNLKVALKIIKKILVIDSNHSKALRLKGIIKLQKGKVAPSIKIFKKSLRADDKDQRTIAYYSIASRIDNNKKDILNTDKYVREYKIDARQLYKDTATFNQELSADIKNHSLLRKEPFGLAARNGYLTDDLFRDKTKAIMLMRELFIEKIKDYMTNLPNDKKHYLCRHKTLSYKLSAWATLVHGDGFIDKHIHEESLISGAYYCKIPKRVANSETKEGYFEHSCLPYNLTPNKSLTKHYIKPEEGKLLIFPSYLYHQTIPHNTDEERISIAFDITPLSWLK